MFFKSDKTKIKELEKQVDELQDLLGKARNLASQLHQEKLTNEWFKNQYDLWEKLLKLGTTYYKSGDTEFKK